MAGTSAGAKKGWASRKHSGPRGGKIKLSKSSKIRESQHVRAMPKGAVRNAAAIKLVIRQNTRKLKQHNPTKYYADLAARGK